MELCERCLEFECYCERLDAPASLKQHDLVLLVTGDRNWTAKDVIYEVLDNVQPRLVVHGNAKGADSIAGRWADERGVSWIAFPARWQLYGKGAGPIRNRERLDFVLNLSKQGQSVHCVAFHDDLEHSKGTANMVKQAHDAGLSVAVFRSHGDRMALTRNDPGGSS